MLHLEQDPLPGAGSQTQSLHLNVTQAHFCTFNPFQYGVLQATKTSKSYTTSFGNSKLNYPQLISHVARGIEFNINKHAEDESQVSSPPLWKTSPPHHSHSRTGTKLAYGQLTDEEKSERIARGQAELMEMVGNMPESAYELSLRDLVELPASSGGVSKSVKKLAQKRRGNAVHVMRDVRKTEMKREFLLKMFVPSGLGLKKKSSSSNGMCSRVSPKPQKCEVEKSVDVEWWRRRCSSAGDSSSCRTSRSSSRSNGSSNGRVHVSGFLGGCWPFYQTKRS